MKTIDWEAQWQAFAPHFYEGVAHIDLSSFGGPCLLLKPGAGFGDFSHPTTRLMVSLIAPLVREKVVFDIGCGSGILSIASLLLGAKKAIGIDIEEEAIAHSRENAKLNGVEKKAYFAKKLPQPPKEACVIVMNMIESEQKLAWRSVSSLHNKPATLITSGILSEQKERYLQLAKDWGFEWEAEKEEEGWLGFVFINPGPKG